MSNSKQFIFRHFCSAALLIGGLAIAGCQHNDPSPTFPPTPTAPPAPKEMIPAGAQTLSEAPYAQVAFKVPDKAGLLYVVDSDTGTIIKTNVVSSDAGKSMTLADLKNVTQGLDITHHFKVEYVPSEPTTNPTKP